MSYDVQPFRWKVGVALDFEFRIVQKLVELIGRVALANGRSGSTPPGILELPNHLTRDVCARWVLVRS